MQTHQAVMPRSVVVTVGLGLTGLYVLVFVLLMNRTDYDTWGAMAIAPILLVLTLPMLAKQAERENDRRLFWVLCAALAVKLLATLIRYYVVFDVYGGRADAQGYHGGGIRIAENFLRGDFTTHLEDFSGTNFIELLTGVVYTITRPSLLGGFFVYSWFAFLGMFFFYRAFVLAVPQGRSRTYARLLFFLPSMLFWPASIGKESFMVLALGVAAYGVAHVVTGKTLRGVLLVVLSLWPAAVVRPHIAGMMAIALVAAFLVQPMRARGRPLAFAFRVVTLIGLVAISVFLVRETQDFLKAETLAEALSQTTDQTGKGGSEFEPVSFFTPLGAPIAAFTVLYRPTIVDAHNVQALLAGIEGTLLVLLTVLRWRWVVAALGSIRRQPYVACAVAYTGMCVIGFSSFANFALLARERVQLLPVFFVLLSVPRRSRAAPAPAEHRAERALVATGSGTG